MYNSQNEFIIKFVEQVAVSNQTNFAVLAFLLYDTALLFDHEVKYVLKPPKNSLSFLYFAMRYSGILFAILGPIWNHTNATSHVGGAIISHTSTFTYSIIEGNLFYLSNAIEVLLILCIDYILLLRVQALYSKGEVITIVLATVFVIEGVCITAIEIQSTIEQKPQPFPLAPGITYCVSLIPGSVIMLRVAFWCIPLAYGILLMTLAVYKSAKILKEDMGLNTNKIVKIIVRDQVIYFMALILISAGAIIFSFFPSSTLVIVLANALGSPAILSSVGPRLLLNMKEAGAKGLNEGMGSSGSKATVSGMYFAESPAQNSVISERVNEGGVYEEIELVEV